MTYNYYAGNSATGTPLAGGAPTAAGTYTVVASYAGSTSSSDYAATTSKPVTFTIAKAAPIIVLTPPAGGTYTGSAFPATATIAGVVATGVNADTSPVQASGPWQGGAFNVAYYAGKNTAGPGSNAAPSSAGQYTVVAKFGGSSNYAAASVQSTFTIAQAAPEHGAGDVTVIVTAASKNYNGSPDSATAKVAGSNGVLGSSLDGVTPTLAYYAGTAAIGTSSTVAPTNAGTYTVQATFPGSTHYTTSVKSDPVTFSIGLATPKIAVSVTNGVYGGSQPAVSALITGVVPGPEQIPSTKLENVGLTLTYYVGKGTAGTSLGGLFPPPLAHTPWWPPSPASPAALIIRQPPAHRLPLRLAKPRQPSRSRTRAGRTTARRPQPRQR